MALVGKEFKGFDLLFSCLPMSTCLHTLSNTVHMNEALNYDEL